MTAAASPAAEPPALVDAGDAVLLVEDDPTLSRLLVELLERRGCTAVAAATVVEAEARLAELRFDLIVSDYRLEGQATGLDLLVRVRAALGPRQAFVLTSSAFPPGAERRAQLLGATTVDKGELVGLVSDRRFHR